MTARLIAALAVLVLMPSLGCAAAFADDWHSEQPLTIGSDVPVSLGAVYDIEFWAPNRGVLITDRGLWAYDSAGWHQLSTVCGGARGRIAWARPSTSGRSATSRWGGLCRSATAEPPARSATSSTARLSPPTRSRSDELTRMER